MLGSPTVVPAGQDEWLADEILKTISSATEVVVITSFLLAWRDLLEAVRAASDRGVRVYVMTASEQRVTRRDRGDDELEQERVEQHLELLDALMDVALVRTSPGFHAKSVLVDPAGAAAGWLLTANLTHPALTLNDELGIRLSADEARTTFSVLRFAWWEMAQHHAASGALRALTPAGVIEVERPTTPLLALLPYEAGLLDELIEAIETSSSLVLTNYSWSADHPVTLAVGEAAARGTDVTVVTRASENTAWSGPVMADLAGRGARVLGTDRMHAKTLVCDERVIVHTMNYGMAPDGKGLELGLQLDGDRAGAVRGIVRTWVDNAPWRLAPNGTAQPEDEVRVPIDGGWKEQELQSRRSES